GDKFLEVLAQDLQSEFPETSGFSLRNIQRMRQFAKLYPDESIATQPVSQLPWSQILMVLQIKELQEREWYIQKTIEQGWSRSTLEREIKSNLYKQHMVAREKVSNYLQKLPELQSFLAHEMLKSPYNFDFLGLHDEAYEREIEHGLIQHIKNSF
ncbi:MAG: DUF1016 N-terminal domain-containing protein, partial [Bdellovibrionota bacterium]